MTNKRELVLKAFKGEKVERVPVGFWYHFAEEDELLNGFQNPDIFAKNVEGHRHFVQEVEPDFVKIMSDGFFSYPNPLITDQVRSIKDLAAIESIGDEHPWFDQQVALVKEVRAAFIEDIVAVYNIFAPLTHLKWQISNKVAFGDELVANFLKEDPQTFRHVLKVIAQDLATLVKKIITEAGADGIYYSAQTIQVPGFSSQDYKEYISESDLIVLEAANQAHGQNILHICGYKGASNDVTIFKDYPVQVVNWAVGPEGLSLKEGKRLFGGKTVLGGFENTEEGLLYTGSKEDIQAKARELVAENGQQGIIIGADCTIPSDIDNRRIAWVREALAE